jgi:hypothetical protein
MQLGILTLTFVLVLLSGKIWLKMTYFYIISMRKDPLGINIHFLDLLS